MDSCIRDSMAKCSQEERKGEAGQGRREKKKKKLSKNMDLASDYCQIDPMEKI